MIDAEQWRRLSPLLDELLDLDPAASAARLETLRAQDPELSSELASLLAGHEGAAGARFLEDRLSPVRELDSLAASTLAGRRVGAYVVDAPLGQGGAGAVWKAHRVDGRFEGTVALKLLHLSLVGRAGALRFQREGAILARLSHPNIARLLDAGVTDTGQPYLILELIEGERIDTHCDRLQLDIEARIDLFCRVLEAVSHAHRYLVIHRDIKPGNIMVGREGEVKLLDFGIAKLLQESADEATAAPLTRDDAHVLTPLHAAPEQLTGEPITTATDVYALGILLYGLLAGRHPTAPAHATAAEVVRATLEALPAPMANAAEPGVTEATQAAAKRLAADRRTTIARLRRQLRGDLDNIVAKALRKPPGERYPTVDAFHNDLRRCLAGEPVSARAQSLAYRAIRFVSRHRVSSAAVALTVLAIALGLVGTITQAHRATAASRHAIEEAAVARSERDNALAQERLARGTNEFLQLLMRDAAGGEPGAVRRQLDRARELIGRTRFETPMVGIALQYQLAGRYEELGDTQVAGSLLRDAMTAAERGGLVASGSGVPVNLACNLAFNLLEADEPKGALVELDRADRMIAAGARVSVPSQVECRVNRGYAEVALGRYSNAVSRMRDALAMLDRAGIRDGEQRRVVRSALSRALFCAGLNAQAMAIARPLLAESESGQGNESIAILRRSSLVTSITRAGGDPRKALELSDQDQRQAARLFGGRDDVTIGLEHARILLALGRNHEAAEAFRRYERAARSQNEAEHLMPLGLGVVAALLAAGRVADAERQWADLGTQRTAAVREGRPEQIESLRLEAALLAARANYAAAYQRLDEAERIMAAQGGASHPMTFAIAYTRASMILDDSRRAGRPLNDAERVLALTAVERAVAAARRSALDPTQSCELGRALLLRARILAAAGHEQDAIRSASDARPLLDATLDEADPSRRLVDHWTSPKT